MKLRFRSIQSNQTFKIEVPNSCTLPHLKQILSQISDSPPLASIRLSLNRKDELRSDGEESLQSLGITSGDLIFFSIEQHAVEISSPSQNTLPQRGESSALESQNSLPNPCSNSPNALPGARILDSVMNTLGNDARMEEVERQGNGINPNSYPNSSHAAENAHSVPDYLRKFFTEELGDCETDRKLLAMAIHAVMLDSGFVCFDRNSNKPITTRQLHNSWSSNLLGTSLHYTLPVILNSQSSSHGFKTSILKFQSLGKKFTTLYGTIGTNSESTHRVHFNEDRLIPSLNALWANCGEPEVIKEVLSFWRSMKDNLALPLLIDLCTDAGLQLPPCFTQLGADLKLKILESLQGSDIARVCCVCSELQQLGSNDDLWKLKLSEEFGVRTKEPYSTWKEAFATTMRNRQNVAPSPFWRSMVAYYPRVMRMQQNPFMVQRVPRMISADEYELSHRPGGREDMEGRLRFDDWFNRRRMNLAPCCNLGRRFA
ncbi:F-box protein SKIP22-like [Andrographis paniculata]|uniref:F-box protein SKIP22-like n=1 Tax=Andrographis paniculata TaxID=175694 RepID=UPI0021E915BC|nr:F-box protein SKIP22-like [Andrographis paniculata]